MQLWRSLQTAQFHSRLESPLALWNIIIIFHSGPELGCRIPTREVFLQPIVASKLCWLSSQAVEPKTLGKRHFHEIFLASNTAMSRHYRKHCRWNVLRVTRLGWVSCQGGGHTLIYLMQLFCSSMWSVWHSAISVLILSMCMLWHKTLQSEVVTRSWLHNFHFLLYSYSQHCHVQPVVEMRFNQYLRGFSSHSQPTHERSAQPAHH